MNARDRVNILLVDDQPAKLLSYEAVLRDLGENLLTATSARQALEHMLKNDIAVMIVDVCMPELDGFELAAMIREHPRFQQTAIIFVSAVLLTDLDRLRGYECGAVDYMPVPIVPEILRAKVKVFAELYRKTQQLEQLNGELERRVADRTAALEASTARLRDSEAHLRLALSAAGAGTWSWDIETGAVMWSPENFSLYGLEPSDTPPDPEACQRHLHPEDRQRAACDVRDAIGGITPEYRSEFRVIHPRRGERWLLSIGKVESDAAGKPVRMSGINLDITERKEVEARLRLLAAEVDHRSKNMLAIVQVMLRQTRADDIKDYVRLAQGRVAALARVHAVLAESRWNGAELSRLINDELAPFRREGDRIAIDGPPVSLGPTAAQSMAIALHELVTNAAKYGALSVPTGQVAVRWRVQADGSLGVEWSESDGPLVRPPTTRGFGSQVIARSIEQQLQGAVQFLWNPAGCAAA